MAARQVDKGHRWCYGAANAVMKTVRYGIQVGEGFKAAGEDSMELSNSGVGLLKSLFRRCSDAFFTRASLVLSPHSNSGTRWYW